MELAFLTLTVAVVVLAGWLGACKRRRRDTEPATVGMRCTVGPPPEGFE